MSKSRRLAALGVAITVAGAVAAGPAWAQETQVEGGEYGGEARAEALDITVFGQKLTTSSATAQVTNANGTLAKATATEVFLGPVSTVEQTAEVTAVGQKVENPAEGCTGEELEELPGIVRSELTCPTTLAELTAAGGHARGLGAQLVLEPSASELLATLGLQEPVQAGTDQVFADAINPLVEALTGNPVGDLVQDGTETVQDVLNRVLTLQSTARIVVAPALAEVVTDAETVTSSVRAQGIRIELLAVEAGPETNGLLPEDLEVGEPLVTITIGDAQATKVVKRADGSATTDAKAATVVIEFGSSALTDALGLPDQTITVAPNQSFCIPGLEGTPLETCVTVAAAGVDANGNPFADGSSVQLFKGVNGGIDLAVGRAATTGAAPALELAAASAGELPRTGGPAALPVLGGGLLALAAVARRFARKA